MTISKEEIEHLKDLARVEFGQKEAEKLAKDLGEVLSYVEQLKEVDISKVPEMTHALESVSNVFRKDEFSENLKKGGITTPHTPLLTKEGGEGGGVG